VKVRAHMTSKTIHHWHGTLTTDAHTNIPWPMKHNHSHMHIIHSKQSVHTIMTTYIQTLSINSLWWILLLMFIYFMYVILSRWRWNQLIWWVLEMFSFFVYFLNLLFQMLVSVVFIVCEYVNIGLIVFVCKLFVWCSHYLLC